MSALWWSVASAGTVVTLVGTFFAFRRSRRRAVVDLLETDLHITVMKPLSGHDARLEQNLETFARLDAPDQFEVLLCLAGVTDGAWPVAQKFAHKYPKRFRIHVGALATMGNAKIAQLASAWPLVKNPFVWVSESNVETSQDFMEQLARTWKLANLHGRRKTLVHAPLVGVHGEGLGAAFERMHLSSLQNPNHELGLIRTMHAVVGKTEFFHRDDIEAMGGLEAFGNYLGEDYMLGVAFAREGVVRCTSVATRNVLGRLSVKAWFERHARWAVMRKTLVGSTFYFLEPQVHLAWPTILWLVGVIPAWLWALLVACRVFVDGFNWSIQTNQLPRVTDLLLVPAKEAVLFVAWVRAVFTFQVKWRAGRVIRLGPNSLVVSSPDTTAAPQVR